MKYKEVTVTAGFIDRVEITSEKWTDPGGKRPNGAGSPARSRTYPMVHSNGGIVIEDLHDPLLDIVDAEYDDYREVTKINTVLRKDGSVRVDLILDTQSTFAEDVESLCEIIVNQDEITFEDRRKAKDILDSLNE